MLPFAIRCQYFFLYYYNAPASSNTNYCEEHTVLGSRL